VEGGGTMEVKNEMEARKMEQKVMEPEVVFSSNFVAEDGAFSGVPSIIEEEDVFIKEVKRAEKRLEALARQRMLIIKLTRPYDWINFNGTAYLKAYGAERLRHFFNISYKIVDKPEVIRHEDGHFTVIFRGTFTWGDQTIEEIGIRSSKDPFFSKAGGQQIPPDQIRMSDVIKAARSNLIARGIATLLGLRGLSIADVSKMLGKIETQVEFKKKKVEEQAQGSSSGSGSGSSSGQAA
jgi:hypothetical protein